MICREHAVNRTCDMKNRSLMTISDLFFCMGILAAFSPGSFGADASWSAVSEPQENR